MSLIDVLGLRAAAPARRASGGLLARIARWAALARQRRALDALDDRLLDDVGICRDVAAREAARPPWQTPESWRGRW